MSNRKESRDYQSRGGGHGRGRGGYNGRRYWDNDNYYDKRDDRRRHSRSRSRSRSYSPKSKSRSPKDRRDSRDEYLPISSTRESNQYELQPSRLKADYCEYESQMQINGKTELEKQEILRLQQLQAAALAYQMQQRIVDDPSLTFGGYGHPEVQRIGLENVQIHNPLSDEIGKESGKKNKEKRKKKKRKRSSSSSSSSSSDSSSGSRKHRKSKHDSEDSSDNSSHEEKRQKEKDKSVVTGSLTNEQKQALSAQQDGYRKKLEILEREIARLQRKEDELKHNRDDVRLVDENLQLQAELKGRCKAVHIVLEKISNVLIEDKVVSGHPVPPPPPQISQSGKLDAKSNKKDLSDSDVNYVDGGNHWCRLCNVFPENVEKLLDHFHSKAHREQVEQLGVDDKPWRQKRPTQEISPGPLAKTLPYRGMQFFSPVEGWYCRLCNVNVNDHLCATIHLKSADHNSNYMTFLEEHSDWESKWSSDREKARQKALGVKTEPRKSRFETIPIQDDGMERSIRVQMRNTVKVENFEAKFTSKTDSKDTVIDEWMEKPHKAPVDVIDTQKFAEIVRQRHGTSKKDEVTRSSRKAPSPSMKEHDSKRGDSDRRRYDRLEIHLSSRDNRERNRDSRGGRRRSRSRSKSPRENRTRDRGYQGRKRSISPKGKDRREPVGSKNTRDSAKKMPMIGKMPVYKRSGKDKNEPETEVSAEQSMPEDQSTAMASTELQDMSYDESAMYVDASAEFSEFLDDPSAYSIHEAAGNTDLVFPPVQAQDTDVTDLKPPGEKEAPGGTNLPDDLLHALDIIYKGGGKPIPVPPPNFPMGIPSYDYTAYSNYPGYENYQMVYNPVDTAVPGNCSTSASDVKVVKPEEKLTHDMASSNPEPEDGDDEGEDDLRMLGIDPDDSAVVKK